MAENLVRQGSLFGGNKNIVGNKYSDLVLETLGKVYIKTGNSSRVLNDIFKLLDKYNEEDSQSKTIITESLDSLEYPGDGALIFDAKNKALYIAYDQRYVLIIDSLEYVDDAKGYVKKSGDTMTGVLTIKTEGAPLIVASKELVKNLNAEYLGGHSASRFAVKTLNEKIYGEWSFQKTTNFNGVTKFNNKAIHNDNLVMDNADIVTTGSIGSPEFASGFQGYGWRFDATTQMLTVDYLVVRKAMQVFELIVNQVKATNGSLWVTDSCEVEEVFEVHYLDITKDLSTIVKDRWYIPYNGHVGTAFTSGNNVQTQIIPGEFISGPGKGDVGSGKTYYNFNYLVKFNEIPENLNTDSFRDLSNFEEECEVVNLFKENTPDDTTDCVSQLDRNTLYNLETTPYFFSTNKQTEFKKSDVRKIYSYYKYFGIEAIPEISQEMVSRKIKIVKMKEETYPTFAEGDLVRCQKFQNNNIKYYDALVGTNFGTYYYVMLVADSVFDKATTVTYDSEGNLKELTEVYNTSQYDKTSQIDPEALDNFESTSENFYQDFEEKTTTKKVSDDPSLALTSIAAKDGLVRIGNLYKTERQNSVFITSSEEYSPYVQTMNGVDRPDYSVIYTSPKFKTKRKVLDGVIRQMYYTVSDETPEDADLYEEEWVIDDKMENYSDINRYIFSETGTVKENGTPAGDQLIYLNDAKVDDSVNDLIELEHIYKKQYLKYFLRPTLDCEIEYNSVTGLYKSQYTNHIRARFGRLDGIHNEMFGNKQPYGYGLYGDNVFLTGEFFLSNGQAVADIGEDIKFEITNDYGKAGLYIESEGGKPYIVLTADQIKILNNGKQSALFTNGRIEAALVRVSDLEAADTYVYFVDAITYDNTTKEPVTNEHGEIEVISQEFSFKPGEESVHTAIATNGHKDMTWTVNGETTYTTYSVRVDEGGEVITEIDKTQPYVRIDSTTGILEANSANLTGGSLTLYNVDKTVKVDVTADSSHAGMIISRLEGSDYNIVTTYNGDVYTDPSIFYKSDSVEISYTSSQNFSWEFGIENEGLHESYEILYNKNLNSSFIPNWVDDYGYSYGSDYGPIMYTRNKTYIISEEFELTKPCDVRIQGSITLDNFNLHYKAHESCSQFARIVYIDQSNGYEYTYNNAYQSKTSNFNSYEGQVNYGNSNPNFNTVAQIKPGKYKLGVKIEYNLHLSNQWYEDNPDYYSWMEVPKYSYMGDFLYGPYFNAKVVLSGVTVLSNKFETKYFGNGFTSGFNQQNYFSVFNNQSSSNPAMIMDFQSNGAGMLFQDGSPYYYVRLGTETAKLAMPIPIYSAYITPSSWIDGIGMNYTDQSTNYLTEVKSNWGVKPRVWGYRYWKEKQNGYIMYPRGANEEENWERADIIIDFRDIDAYKGVDFTNDNIIIQLTGHPYYTQGSTWARNIYACVYARDDKVIRVKVQDDSSGNDGSFFITIYYLPAKAQPTNL